MSTATEHHASVNRRGGGWGWRCSCGEAPNRSTRQRRIAEGWAKDHVREHAEPPGGEMTEPSPVQIAWDKYQAAAARNPYSDETKRARTAYKRALTVADRKRREAHA